MSIAHLDSSDTNSFSVPIEIPKAKHQISIDSTSSSYAEDDMIIIDDYIQNSNNYPQRPTNPLPFEKESTLPEEDTFNLPTGTPISETNNLYSL
ncbi:hypothetical protein KM1_017870 [Entamoeba histolytica HM-3:IMSS]|uniref:Uncharacterized protein n=2 Tax=Entamoeba histolytica TaxID=5759 RepID=N9TQJ2_ENTH1|nr:hypothetical protein KM1_017870 [Entamoeba histolytica HM-3:IMSS]ENY65895.1 unknown protein, putative [Entamoeba histolytica HM-1:IMSS-A]